MELPLESVEFDVELLKLNNTDPRYAPSTTVIFFNEVGDPGFSFGITKTDGTSGLAAVYSFGAPSEPRDRYGLVTDLKLGEKYRFQYSYAEGVLTFSVAGTRKSVDLGFHPSRVLHLVSGLKGEFTDAP